MLRDTFDRPLHDLRISVMDRCNFRCPYCMPQRTYHDKYRFLSSQERLSFAEIVRLAKLFTQLGVRKLRLTGGEPLLRHNIDELIADLSQIDGIEDIALTTNGILLAQHAAQLKAAGLNRITVSLDSLDAQIFRQMSGGYGEVSEVLHGIEQAQHAGLAPIKINTVVQRGINDHTLIDLVKYFKGTGVIVRFIEYMDVGNRNDWQPERVVSAREILAQLSIHWPLRAVARQHRSEVAQRYVSDDGSIEIGFITSVSEPFCGNCSRARLSSNGVFYSCLFATAGTELRGLLRSGASDSELLEKVRVIWRQRTDRYSELRAERRQEQPLVPKIEMHYIGG
jgi:GTP 3',8-cyclase